MCGHNHLQDEVFNLCRHAHLSISVTMASPETLTTPDLLISSLLDGTCRGKPAALDITITSPAILGESCHHAGAAEACKLYSSGPNARRWAGRALYWQWRHMAIGAKRPMIPSPVWHPNWPFTSPPPPPPSPSPSVNS